MTDFTLGARRVSDLPFLHPSSDHQRLANALWLIENNPGGRALLPADDASDDQPRFAAVVPSTSSGATADRILSQFERGDARVPNADATPPQISRTLLAQGKSSSPTAGPIGAAKPSGSSGRTKVTLFYRPIHGTTIMHSYVVAEGNGERFYVGAFPERDLGFVSNVGQAAMDAVGIRAGYCFHVLALSTRELAMTTGSIHRFGSISALTGTSTA